MPEQRRSNEGSDNPNEGSHGSNEGNHGESGDGGEQLLAAVRRAYVEHDPPSATLAERVLFAIRLEDLDAEVARLVEDLLVPAGARGEEPARTVTFSSSSLTVTITITPADHGHSRVDGWVAPAGRHRVEVRRTGGHAQGAHAQGQHGQGQHGQGQHGQGQHGQGGVPDAYTDDAGRFVLADVPPGLTQLVFHPVEQGESAQVVAAPPLEL